MGGSGDAMVEDEERSMEREEDEMADSWEEEDEEEEGDGGDADDFRMLVSSEGRMRWRERGGEGGVGGKEWSGSASMQFDGDAGTSHAADLARGVWFRISTRALPAHVARLLGCLPSQPSNQLSARAGVAEDACGSAAPHAHPPDKTPEEDGVIGSKGAAGVLNLDVTAAVALVSELSHGGAQRIAGLAEPDLRARFGNSWQFMRDQVGG
ncbi:unnamed protein product [Closterium sp. NIES-53]